MANKFRNEKEIEVAGVKILLRPTFQNVADLENILGRGIPMLAYELSKRTIPKLTECALVVFHCQAEKKYTLEEIWDLVSSHGALITTDVLTFIAQITNGDKNAPTLPADEIKKN